MKSSCVLITLLMVAATISSVMATSILVQKPEDVVKQSPLIVQVTVKRIDFRAISNLSTGEAWITLTVIDRIVGDCPSEILIRRGHVTPDLRFLEREWDPSYTVSEHFMICLLPTLNGYSTMGLYNGKFAIDAGYIRGTKISINEFAKEIREIRNGQRSNFPNELPRHTAQAVKNHLRKAGKESRIMAAGSHLIGEFITWDFTWNTSYLPVQMHYNSANAPAGTPNASTIASLAATAYGLWADTYSFLTLQNGSPFTTSAGRVDDDFSVISWYDPGNGNRLAETHTFPNDLVYGNFYGPNSNKGVDVWLNYNIAGTWYFNQTAPTSFSASQVDFVEILAHELGHGIGLRHVSNTNSIMLGSPYGSYLQRTGSVRGQTDGDFAGRVYQHTSTSLSGTFAHTVVLSASSNSFSMTGNVTVPTGKTFEIESGKTLNFDGYYKLRVEGTLNASYATFQGSGYPGTWFGIEFYNASGQSLGYSTIKDAAYGLNFINTDVAFSSPRIRDNTYGVNCTNYSDPTFNASVFQTNGWAVYGDATSAPSFTLYTGYNSFRTNDYYDIYSTYSGTIYARGNWWGACPPYPSVTANVDYSNYLCSDPNPRGQLTATDFAGLQFSKGVTSSSSQSISPGVLPTPEPGMSQLNAAYLLYVEGKYADALQAFEAVVAGYPDNFAGRRALVFMERTLDKLGRSNEILATLNSASASYSGKSLGEFAKARRVYQYINQGRYQDAVTQAAEIVHLNDDSTLVKFALYDLGGMYWYYLGDTKTGEQYYRQLIARFPKDHLSNSALATLGEWKPEEPSGKPANSSFEQSKEPPTQYALTQNYPNPFNPSTVISYQLPTAGYVTLKLYNTLGQEVATLVDGIQDAGLKSVTFDATRLPSGVYFYQLQSGTFIQNRKMLLVK
jgi:tetratricopeptide (TPR) repeat protein